MRGPPPNPGRLVSFTLRDVPLDVRQRAVASARMLRTGGDVKPEDRLLAALGDAGDAIARAAENPSGKRYWITEAAFHAVLDGVRTAA